MTGAALRRTRPLRGLNGVTIQVDQLIALRSRATDLSFGALRSSRNPLSGQKMSRFRGRGMDYAESRSYAHGDDIRTMDWRVTARTGRPHTKIFQEERERPVLLLVDIAESMRFGTRRAFKSVVAAETAALLAWAVVANGDRVGTLAFSASIHRESKPRGGRRGALQALHAIAAADRRDAETSGMDLSQALARTRRVARPGTLVFVISDFYGMDEEAGRHLQRLHDHNDIFCLRIIDPVETAPPRPGRYAISDGAATTVIDTHPGAGRDRYLRFAADLDTSIAAHASRAGARLGLVTCGDDVADRLRIVLGTQAGVARPGT